MALALVLGSGEPASSQIIEATGSRALGMGGAFVAVANDASATWWNPAGLADGPFLDMSLARSVTESGGRFSARRDSVSSFVIGTPPFGLSYYRLRLTEIRGSDPTAGAGGDREEEGVPLRSLSARQVGVTVVRTLTPGVHAGTTVKYLRGRFRSGVGESQLPPSDLLDRGDALQGGDSDHAFDLDIGVLAVGGPIRGGVLIRHLLEPEFRAPDGVPVARLPRQVRLGVAFDGSQADTIPLTVSLDVDLRRYAAAIGDRRVIALGAEQRLFGRRLSLRGGGRLNTVGRQDRAATGGFSVAVRSGLYLDAHVVRGGTAEDQGWGMAARVSF
jgi:hypothetical protein